MDAAIVEPEKDDTQTPTKDEVTPTQDETQIDPNIPPPTPGKEGDKMEEPKKPSETVKCIKNSCDKTDVKEKEQNDIVNGVKVCEAEAVKNTNVENKVLNGGSSEKNMRRASVDESVSKIQISVTFEGEIFTCNECSHTGKGNPFEEHLMCHLLEKPYQCLYCVQAFSTRREIMKHLSTMHKGKKLNCKLKALNRAKTIMQEAQKSKSCVFSAVVTGNGLKLKRNPSTDSNGSSITMSRTTSDDGSNTSNKPLPPSKQDSQISETKQDSIEDPSKFSKVPQSVTEKTAKETEPSKITESVAYEKESGQDGQDVVDGVTGVDKVPSTSETVKKDESDTIVKENEPSCTSEATEMKDNESEQTEKNKEPNDSQKDNVPACNQDSNDIQSDTEHKKSDETKISNDSESCEKEDVQSGGETTSEPVGEKNNSSPEEDHTPSAEMTEVSDKKSQDSPVTSDKDEDSCAKEKSVSETISENVTQNNVEDSDSVEDSLTKSDTIEQCEPEENPSNKQDMKADDVQENQETSGKSDDSAPAPHVEECVSPKTCESGVEKQDTPKASETDAEKDDTSKVMETDVEKEDTSKVMETDVEKDCSKESKKIEDESTSQMEMDTEQKAESSICEKNSSEKNDQDDTSIGIKIVSSFSIEGEEQTKEDQPNNEVKTSDDEGKGNEDTSGVVIDVFKDGSISVHDTNSNSPKTSETANDDKTSDNDSVPTTNVPEPSPVVHQTKLSQLLTSNEPCSISTISSAPTVPKDPVVTPSRSTSATPSPAPSTATLNTSSGGTAQNQVPTQAQMKHMRNPNFYVCGLNCNFSCLNSVDFRDHLFIGHAGERAFPCYYCGYMAHTEESLLRHITNHAHTNSKTAPLYLCGVHKCRFGTNLLSDLLNHMQILHPDITQYVCKECNDSFPDMNSLVTHFEENFIHVVNCPHCACKGTDRRMILAHIAEYHPGKARMVSVAKHNICKDRKVNNYKVIKAQYKLGVGALLEKNATKLQNNFTNVKNTASSDNFQTVNIKQELLSKGNEPVKIKMASASAASGDKSIDAPKCGHCTFVARDQRRLEGHVRCHGLPVMKKYRFRCLYCPQGFDNSQKFKLHINCHPGLIKYWMYFCKACEFDTNQRYVMLRHIRTRDALHINEGSEEDMFSVVEKILESRVLECEHCNYQTRHKLHLQIHYQRQHKVLKAAAKSTSEEKYKAASQAVPWTSPTHSSSPSDPCQENMSKKFKCPFCRYLVPKAADLKAHVRKHANLGKITLDFFRCRYCSLSSTARNIVYSHIREKHPGKLLVLVRKTVTIDCSGSDNSFSETSVTEAPLTVSPSVTSGSHSIDRFQCDTCSFSTIDAREFESHVQLHNRTKSGLQSPMDDESDEDEDDNELESSVDHPQPDVDEENKSDAGATQDVLDMIEQVYVIPETVAGDQLSTPARCCSCYYASGYRSAFADHMKTNHPEVMIVMRNKATTVEQMCPSGKMLFGLPATLNNEILLVPDKQVFTQAVKCPKCPNFATYFRRNLVIHLSKDHSEITAMGKCTWPGWQASSGGSTSTKAAAQSILTVPNPRKKILSPKKSDETCIIGSGDLDEEIKCLYKNFGDRQQCLICNAVKPKKFFMHIHLLRHLNIYLFKCPYCIHKGLQKYKMGRHITTVHPAKENVVEEIINDVPQRVADFLAQQKKVITDACSPSKQSPFLSAESTSPEFSSTKREKDQNALNKMSGPLGTPYLDEKLLCLYNCEDGKNKCNLCSVEFSRKYAIHRHIVVNHLKVALLKCGYCDFEGVEKHVVIDHILEQHKYQQIQFEPLDIDMEQKVQEFLSTYTVVKSEPKQEAELPTMSSPLRFSGPQAYVLGKEKLHNKLVPLFTNKGDNNFKCNLCKWKFPRRYAIHRHLLMKHLKVGLYGCTHCHFQGAEKYIVIAHMKEAHPSATPQARILEVDMDKRVQEAVQEMQGGSEDHEPMYIMPSIDDASDDTSQDMKTEFETENTEKKQMVVAMFGKKRKSPEPSPAVGNSLVTPKKLKTTSRMVDVSTEIKVVCIEDGNFKKFVCEKCRFTSLHRSNVYRHVLRVHEKYKELQCDVCGYKTYSKFLLDQHMEVEHDGITPRSTHNHGSSVSIKQELKTNEESSKQDTSASSNASKHYACAYCDYETSTADDIIKHTRVNHAPGGPDSQEKANDSDSEVTVSTHEHVVKKSDVRKGTFTESQMLYCGYCTFKAPGVQAVKDHHKDSHLPNKLCIISPQPWRYICKVCGLKNNAGSKMRCHLNRHLEYRPYTCSTCSQSYASTDELRKHVRNLRHSDSFQYIKHDKKEQKVNRFLEESRKNALLVNIGAPPGEESMGNPVETSTQSAETETAMEQKPPPKESKFQGIKRPMKMPMSPAKSLKKKYWKAGLDRESRALTRDIACHWCDIPHTVSVDQVQHHHLKEHPDKDFLWVDTRSGHTCTGTGEIVIAGDLHDVPKISDLYTSKHLGNGKNKFYCSRCPFSAWYLPAMISHCRCHLPKKYLCGYCHMRYSNKDYLEKHQRTFHPHQVPWILHMVEKDESSVKTEETETTVPIKETSPAPVQERRISQTIQYTCNFCPYKNESLYQYRLHLPVHGTFKYLKTDISNDSPLKCGFCPFVAQDQADFSLHITEHFENRSYKCKYCNYSAYTRGHVRSHTAGQHPNEEIVVLDLSSVASYVEYLKPDATNMPRLVNIDPRVVLTDITTLGQSDLETLINSELNKDITRPMDNDEREEVDVEGMGDPAAEADHTPTEDSREEVSMAEASVPQQVDSSVESEGPAKKLFKDDADADASSTGKSGEVSSSVDVAEGFDQAEVSAFVDEESAEGKENVCEGKKGDDTASSSVDEVKNMNGESNASDEVDGRDKVSRKEQSPDSDDKAKKDDSGNVFDTLHSWLSMK